MRLWELLAEGRTERATSMDGQPFTVLINPSREQFDRFLKKTRYDSARGVIDLVEGDLYVWDGFYSTHGGVAFQMGLTNYIAIDLYKRVFTYANYTVPRKLKRQARSNPNVARLYGDTEKAEEPAVHPAD